jgi:hypothetical protein
MGITFQQIIEIFSTIVTNEIQQFILIISTLKIFYVKNHFANLPLTRSGAALQQASPACTTTGGDVGLQHLVIPGLHHSASMEHDAVATQGL